MQRKTNLEIREEERDEVPGAAENLQVCDYGMKQEKLGAYVVWWSNKGKTPILCDQ